MRFLCFLTILLGLQITFVHEARASDDLILEEAKSCFSKPTSGCVYKYLTELALEQHVSTKRQDHFKKRYETFFAIADRLIDVGEYDLAKGYTLRGIAETREIYNASFFGQGMILLGRIADATGRTQDANAYLKAANSPAVKENVLKFSGNRSEVTKRYAVNSRERYKKNRYLKEPMFLNSTYSLSEILIQEGRYTEALKVISEIDPVYVYSLEHRVEKDVASRQLQSLPSFDIDYKEAPLYVRSNDQSVITFLDVLFEIALAKYEDGDHEYTRKAVALGEEILTGGYEEKGHQHKYFKWDSRRFAQLAVFYALGGRYEDLMQMNMWKSSGRTRGGVSEPAVKIVRAFLARQQYDKAQNILKEIKNTKSQYEGYELLAEHLFKEKKNLQLGIVLNEFLQITNGRAADQYAETRRIVAKYLYLTGQNQRAGELVVDALAVLVKGRFPCHSAGGYCQIFRPREELLGMLVQNDSFDEALNFVQTSEQYSELGVIAAEKGDFQNAKKMILKSNDLFTEEITNRRAVIMSKYEKDKSVSAEKLKIMIKNNTSYLKKRRDQSYWSRLSKIILYISLSEEKEQHREFYKKQLSFLEAEIHTRDENQGFKTASKVNALIARHLMDGKKLNVHKILIPNLVGRSSRDLRFLSRVLEEAGLSEEAKIVWREFSYLIPTMASVSKHSGEVRRIALHHVEYRNFEAAEKAMMDIVNFRRFFYKSGYHVNFEHRKDALYMKMVAAIAAEGRYDDAILLIEKIVASSTQQDAWFQIAKSMIDNGEPAKAKSLIKERMIPFEKQALELIRRSYIAKHYGGRDEKSYEVLRLLNDRIFVLDFLSLGKELQEYNDFIDSIYLWAPDKEQLLQFARVKAEGLEQRGKLKEQKDVLKKAIKDVGVIHSHEESFFTYVRKVALDQAQAGFNEDAIETLSEGTYVGAREERNMAFLLLAADVYVKALGPIDRETKKYITEQLRTRPHKIEFHKKPYQHELINNKECKLPSFKKDDVQVHWVSIDEGLYHSREKLSNAKRLVKQTPVEVKASEKQIILVLTSNKPNIWSLKIDAGAKVKAILIGGNDARIDGIPIDIPILNYSIANNANYSNCHGYLSLMGEPSNNPNRKLVRVLYYLKEFLGRDVDHIYLKQKETQKFVVKELTQAELEKKASYAKMSPYPKNLEPSPTDFYFLGLNAVEKVVKDKDMSIPEVPKEQEGLNKLVEMGKIRSFTKDDEHLMQKWLDGVNAKFKRFNEDLKTYTMRRPDYIVMKPIIFPTGMSGANRHDFLVLENVMPPQGYQGHSNVYYLSDFTCKGSLSGYCGI